MTRVLSASWRYYRDASLIIKMSLGFVLGLIVALTFGDDASVLAPAGELLLRLLQMIVVPIIMVTLIDAVSTTRSGSVARIASKAFVYYIITTVGAVAISLAIALPVAPGSGLDLPNADTEAPEAPSFVEQLLGIVPENAFAALAEGKILALIFVALIIGLTMAKMSRSEDEDIADLGTTLRKIVLAAKELTFRILGAILQYAPIGVFALVANKIGSQGGEALLALGKLTIVVYAALAVQILVVYIPLLLIYRVRILRFFRTSRDAMLTAFTTQSSSGTIPVTLNCARKAGVRQDVAGFVVPVGATLNMDGAVVRLGASVVLAANIVGREMSVPELIGIVLTATLVSIGTAGVPGAGLIGLTILLTQAGLPIDIVALVAGVDVILGMGATMLNVTSDLAGTHIIDKSEAKTRKRLAVHRRAESVPREDDREDVASLRDSRVET
ncbi:dicarboxylate/amino acid:cation symporter [Arthrobacter castelli]|uniref:dicarboxylate/amino acid:cation symporter n=1 Tax=Arthrobacter castelli TaxID=271431 RepID=UPI0004256E15|nr:dicarboxylate/amino acid:cation symporter [Arthrobacter castelli]